MVAWNRRTETYRGSGSYRFNRAQRESYALILDIKILSYVGSPSFNLKSNPEFSFWGYATTFERATPALKQPVEFAVSRVLNTKNDAAAATFNALAIAAAGNQQITNLSEVVELVWEQFDTLNLTPVLRHDETTIKFKALPTTQFEFICYWLDFPPSDEDFPDFNPDPPATDDDEYYEPQQNPASDPFAGNPTPTAIDTRSDPRDFDDNNDPPARIGGSLSLESSGNNSPFTVADDIPGLFWPGQLVEGNDPSFSHAISWLDDEGVETVIARTNFPPLRIRFVEFNADDGRLFIPDPASFEVL